MAVSNRERVGKGLDLLASGLRPFIERELKSQLGDTWQTALPDTTGRGPRVKPQAVNLDEMEQWVASIARDTAPAKSQLEKVIRNKPAGVTDACYTKDGRKITDMQQCAQMFPTYANPRLNAGQPISALMLKCELKALEKKDYSPALTNAQLAALKAAFPSGVCD